MNNGEGRAGIGRDHPWMASGGGRVTLLAVPPMRYHRTDIEVGKIRCQHCETPVQRRTEEIVSKLPRWEW